MGILSPGSARRAGTARAPSAPRELAAALPSDARLVERAREGDRWALDALYRRHAEGGLRLALRLLGQRCDAEDALHDAFVTAFRRIDDLREPAAFGAWLGRIVTSASVDRLRRRALLTRLGFRPDLDATLDLLAAPEVSAEERVALREIARGLERLAARDRVAWTLRYVEGRTLEETAQLCDCSLATIKRCIARAHDALGAPVALEER